MFNFLFPKPYIETSTDLAGKVVVITGGTKGIGAATAELLSKKGATVISLSRTSETKVDVTNYSSCEKAIKTILEQHGHIDVVINNAGVFLSKSISDTTAKEFEQLMAVNVFGVFNVSKAVIEHMKSKKHGLIINIGSKISHNTNVTPNKVAYASSKYAVEGFSFALNKELKPHGIRVTCLMPGTVATFLSRKNGDYLSPYDVAHLIKMVIESENIDFESVVFKSVNQNI